MYRVVKYFASLYLQLQGVVITLNVCLGTLDLWCACLCNVTCPAVNQISIM